MEQCDKCGRTFNAERLGKHRNVCKGPAKKKPKKVIQRPKKKTKKEPKWKQ